ncbi:MAG: bifunctional adenosylcobinamide kinase/adenosylcobinamide-phosphate guanylyltransferase [Erysipelotrichales bacterium]
MKTLVTGGARSGKSSYAESLYQDYDDVLYIATYINEHNDSEMENRIKKHVEQRNSKWQTYEASYNLDVENNKVMLDCLSVFTSNVLFYYAKDVEYINDELFQKVLKHLEKEVDYLIENNKEVIIVTNEVGSSLVPINHVERIYRDLLGKINVYAANKCNNVYLVVCGQNIKIK